METTLQNPSTGNRVEFYTRESLVGMVGLVVMTEEPATLWLSEEAARIVYVDLRKQGYVKG